MNVQLVENFVMHAFQKTTIRYSGEPYYLQSINDNGESKFSKFFPLHSKNSEKFFDLHFSLLRGEERRGGSPASWIAVKLRFF